MDNLKESDIKKIKLNDIIENQHPVTLYWMLSSLFLICSMYIYSFIKL